MYTIIIKDLEEEVRKLGFEPKLVFAYLSCKRLFPNYVFFSRQENWGNREILKEAISVIKNILVTKKINKGQIEGLLEVIFDVAPEPGNFDTILASSALDACSVLDETLNFIIDKDNDRINRIIALCIDTVDMFIRDRDDVPSDDFNKMQQKVFADPLMNKEIETQRNIILYLKKNSTNIDINDIDTLEDLQYNDGKSNINLN